MTRSESWITTVFAVAFTVMITLAVFEEFSVGRLSVVLFFVFWIPMLVLHEAGHALAARLLGWRVREIVIGFGRTLWQRRIGETCVKVKLAPVEGYVLPAPIERGRLRLKSALIYAAGPGAEILLLAVLVAVFGANAVFGDAGENLLHVCLHTLAFVIVLGAGFNLLPFSTGGAVSDGLGIVSSLYMNEETVELRLLSPDIGDTRELIQAGNTTRALESARRLHERLPRNAALERLYVAALAADGRDDEARERIRSKLAAATLTQIEQCSWLALQARTELYAASPEFLTMDLALQKALAALPDDTELLTLKGASLVLRNRFEDGGNLLADAWRRGGGNDAELLAFLAIAAQGVGNDDAARYFAQHFHEINDSKWLANRLRGRLDRLS